MLFRRAMILTALCALAMSVVACGASRQSGICGSLTPPATAKGDADGLIKQGDAAWEQRADESQLRVAIDSWQKALAIDPNRADQRVKLARAHYFLADGHLRFDEERETEMIDNLRSGTDQAELGLGQLYPAFASKFCSRQPYKVALQQLDKGALGAMYWYATNLGKYALATSIVEVLNQKDRIVAMMELLKSLDKGFFHHAADRYFGAFYTKIPFPSGDLPKSQSHFMASAEGAPYYLATKVLLASMNAAKAGNRALFKQMLDEVVAFDLDSRPDLKPENAAEQRKAKDLLDEIDIYFPEE
ncbi:MAG: TRAP transporter TatT component family protein [Myxococcota bacterium]